MKKENKKFKVNQDNIDKVIKEIKDALLYKVSLKVLAKVYKSEGITIDEAISKLKPLNCKGRGILTVEYGDSKKDRILPSFMTYRLFNSHGMTREITIKNVANLFKGI